MEISVDRTKTESLHLQIAESIRTLILESVIRPGHRLPAVRDLARDLGVHRLTVHKAYQHLASEHLVESVIGRGTYVATELTRQHATILLGNLLDAGPMNRFEPVSDEVGIRSLATSVPDPWLFRADEFLLECYELRKGSPWIFYYAPPAGAHELCQAVASLLTARGFETSPSQIVVTGGEIQSLSLVLAEYLPPGSAVAIEDPMFLGAKTWFGSRGYQYVPVTRKEAGIDLAMLEHAIRRANCRAFILWPAFGHVTGWVLDANHRDRVVDLCRQYDCLLIEMASTSWIALDEPVPDPISRNRDTGRTLFLDDFSNCLSPGVGISYIRAETQDARRLEARLQSEQYSGLQFVQVALASYIERGYLKGHLDRSLPKYKARRDRMMSSLGTSLPIGTRWSYPKGGFSAWIEFPKGRNYANLYQEALARGVAIAPGSMFTDQPDADRFCRLSYGTQEPPAIEEAVRILGGVVSRLP